MILETRAKVKTNVILCGIYYNGPTVAQLEVSSDYM